MKARTVKKRDSRVVNRLLQSIKRGLGDHRRWIMTGQHGLFGQAFLSGVVFRIEAEPIAFASVL
jgi:hypothetical protein